MNVLILEDDKNRNVLFRRNLIGLYIEIRDDVKELKTLLLSKKWDVLFLDHDLGGEVFASSDREDTGAEIARFLKDNPEHKPELIIIHSLNNSGAMYMKHLLPESVYIPFAWQSIDSEQLADKAFISICKNQAETQSARLDMYGKM